MPKLKFPGGSLLAAMLGESAAVDARRAARRLRAEGAPALAIDEDIAGLARGLASSEVSRSPAVLDVLPPLFWLEARREDPAGIPVICGWVVEKKRGGLAARGFRIAFGPEATPEPQGAVTVPFGGRVQDEEEEIREVRGLVATISLPQMLAQMGESSPVAVMPAEAPDGEVGALRGFALSVAVSPDSMPG